MTSRRRTLAMLLLGLVAAFAAGALISPLTFAAPQDREPTNADLQEQLDDLLRQRLALIKTVVDQLRKQYEAGAIPIELVQQAMTRLREAELDLCKTSAARIEVSRKLVEIATEQERLVAKRVTMGVASSVDVARATVARIDAEIWLLRERLNARADSKSK